MSISWVRCVSNYKFSVKIKIKGFGKIFFIYFWYIFLIVCFVFYVYLKLCIYKNIFKVGMCIIIEYNI